jgi:CubicO group peptidase (beta-lactamase class C family)
MKSAGFGAPGGKKSLSQPRGHTTDGKPVEPGPAADNPVAIGPAGTVHCSIGDWAKYVALHLRGEKKDGKLLRAESFKKLHTPAKSPPTDTQYALGWIVAERPWGGGRVLTHAGSNSMWYAVTWIAPERDFAVLVACNQGGESATQACDEAVAAMIENHLNATNQ